MLQRSSESPLSLQVSTEQHKRMIKLLKVEDFNKHLNILEESNLNLTTQGLEQFPFSPAIVENFLTNWELRVRRRALPQYWGKISPRLNAALVYLRNFKTPEKIKLIQSNLSMYVPGKIQEYLQEYKNIQYSTSKIAMCDIQSKMIKYTKMLNNIVINIRNIHRLKPIQKYHT